MPPELPLELDEGAGLDGDDAGAEVGFGWVAEGEVGPGVGVLDIVPEVGLPFWGSTKYGDVV